METCRHQACLRAHTISGHQVIGQAMHNATPASSVLSLLYGWASFAVAEKMLSRAAQIHWMWMTVMIFIVKQKGSIHSPQVSVTWRALT